MAPATASRFPYEQFIHAPNRCSQSIWHLFTAILPTKKNTYKHCYSSTLLKVTNTQSQSLAFNNAPFKPRADTHIP